MRSFLAPFAALSFIVLSSLGHAAPSDELLSYWTLDGNTADSAPGGVSNDNGSWAGAGAYLAAPFGQGADLNGSSYISIPSSADLSHAGSSLSISVWFKVDSWSKNWQCLLSKGEGSNYRIARRAGDTNQLSYAGGTGDIFGGSVNDGEWHHAVAVSDHGNNMFLYIDGVQVAIGGAPSLSDSGLPLYLGENPGATNRQWDGGIDDVGIFDVPLSSFRVAAIHELGSDPDYQYPLGDVMQIFDAHAAGGAVVVDGTTWQYAASDPGGASGFILISGDGSGVVPSQGPTITDFSAAPIFIDTGENATLSWQIDPPFTSVTIDNGVGDVTGSTSGSGAGSAVVSPAETTVYTLTATNADGSTAASTTVYFGIDPTAPRINEFVADSAPDGLVDETGATEDWIELYAPGIADLTGYYLTDDVAIPNKWAFPSMSMTPDSYLVVFASGNDLTGDPAFLHTNFKLNGGGEYLALTRDDGMGGFEVVTEFSPEYPNQEEGFSYGLGSDQVTLGYFNTPTPNAPNGVAFQGFVEDTQFSVGRGFYDTPQTVAITTLTPGATIRYTTDGSTPTTTNGTVYTVPLTISSTTVLRAFAYRADYEPTNVDTQTYFFLEDIRTQYANGVPPSGWPLSSSNGQTYNYGMDPDITNQYSAQQMKDALAAIPSISVVTDLPNLVDASTGIYSNPGGHGSGWERPASVELINPDASPGFQVEAGIRIRGGFSRSKNNPKHAFRLFFRSQYGDAKLNFPLFGNEGADEFDKVDLRTSQNYSWAFQGNGSNTFLREVLGRDLQGLLGQPYTRSRYYHLYLNGVYWGLYMTQERAEANYGATYFKGSKDDFDTLKSAGSSGSYNTEATDGTMVQGSSAAPGSDWADLWFQSRDHHTSPSHAKYMELQGLNPDGSRNPAFPVLLDVDNLIDYTLIIGYTGNYDAPLSDFIGASNNWYAVRNRERDDLGMAFFVHDGEHSLGAGGRWGGANDRINTSNGSGSRGSYNKSNPAFVHFDIASGSEEYRMRFADRAHRALFNGGVLDTASVLATLEARRQIVDQVIIAEAARWGDSKRSTPFNKPDWVNAVNSLTNTINGRRNVFLGHLRTGGLYPNLDAPVYNQHGGVVSPGFIVEMTNTSGQIYYTADGSDPRLVGGGISPDAILWDGSAQPVTFFSLGDSWSYLDDGSDQGSSDVVVGQPGYSASNWKHPDFDDGGWASGLAPLGFGGIGVILNTEINDLDQITTYFRKDFVVTDANEISSLTLSLLREDGAVVYLNGREVARGNLPGGTVLASTTASSSLTGTDESEVHLIPIDPTALVEGNNVLAIELHNSSAGSSDKGLDVGLSGTRQSDGLVIDEPALVNARSLDGGTWSALNSAFFTTGVLASSANIVISEVNYHPYDATPAELANPAVGDEEDFEFVEIMNISSDVVELGGSAFVLTPVNDHLEGIEVEFPDGTLIQPGERLLVVADAAAFAVRYPSVPASKIVGDYANRLSNTGEWITLQAADGSIIDQFRYNDLSPWPVEADGGGKTLVLVDPESNPDHADPASWSASLSTGGSPGEQDGTPFVGNALDDLDGDGGYALVEYLQGLSDTVSSADEFPEVSVQNIAGVDYLTITFRQDPLAVDASVEVELSADLTVWNIPGIFVGSVPGAGGIQMQTYRSPNPYDPEVREFIRLKVTLDP